MNLATLLQEHASLQKEHAALKEQHSLAVQRAAQAAKALQEALSVKQQLERDCAAAARARQQSDSQLAAAKEAQQRAEQHHQAAIQVRTVHMRTWLAQTFMLHPYNFMLYALLLRAMSMMHADQHRQQCLPPATRTSLSLTSLSCWHVCCTGG